MAKAAKKKSTKKSTRAKKKAARKKTGTEVPVKTAAAEPAAARREPTPLADLERLFDDLLKRRWPRPFRWEWPKWEGFPGFEDYTAPAVDIVDRDKEVVVRAEIPGVDKKDLDVSVVDRTLTIRASSRHEEKEEKEDYFRHEIRSGAFSRAILLPADVNAARAKASFKDGVLELTLPKKRVSKRQQISMS